MNNRVSAWQPRLMHNAHPVLLFFGGGLRSGGPVGIVLIVVLMVLRVWMRRGGGRGPRGPWGF